MENGHVRSAECNGDSVQVDPYEKKYFALLKRCAAVQQNNERLVNRLQHVKKLLKRVRHEKRFLMQRLDAHHANYRDIPLVFPVDHELEVEPSLGLSMDIPSSRQPVKSGQGSSTGKGTISSTNWSPRNSSTCPVTTTTKRKSRSDKDRGNSKKASTTVNPGASQQNENPDRNQAYVQINKEDLNKELDMKNWNRPIKTEDNKNSGKAYFDLYEHSYDLLPQPTLDLGMNSMSMHGNS